MKIDFVLPTVSITKEFIKRYVNTLGHGDIEFERYSPDFDLKYVFRSIDKNLPFINKVHLIVADIDQVPDWINKDSINIVYHKDFIPLKYLPTFNSNTIETYIWNIPGLSEHFIYSNDDMLIWKQLDESYFFENEECSYLNSYTQNHSAYNIFQEALLNNYNLLKSEFGLPELNNQVFRLEHGVQSYLKSVYKECFDKYKTELENVISPLRTKYNYTGWVFGFYHIFKKYSKQNINKKVFCCNNSKSTINKLLHNRLNNNNANFTEFCFNSYNTNYLTFDLNEVLDKKFPNKSKYEL